MALPVYAGAGTLTGSISTASPPLPTGWAVDDILLLHVETANQPITAPAGWTEVPNSPQGAGTAGGTAATALQVFWTRATAVTQGPTLIDAGDHTVSVVTAWRGCPTTGDPWDVISAGSEATADTSVSIPGGTTTVGDTLIVAACSSQVDSNVARFSLWACAGALHPLERIDAGNTSGNGGGLGICTFDKYAPGAYGPITATSDTTTKGMIAIALKGTSVDTGPYGSYVLDSFNTNDTTAPLVNWSSGAGDTTAPPAGTHASAGAQFRSSSSAYRQGEHFSTGGTFGGPTQAAEAWVEFDALASPQEFAMKLALVTPVGTSGSDYGFYLDWSEGLATPALSANRRLATVFTNIIPPFYTATWAAGDSLGCVLVPVDTSVRVEIWKKPAGGVWTKIAEGTDASPPSTLTGYIGVQYAGGQGIKSRHLGGGNVTVSTGPQIVEIFAVSEADSVLAPGRSKSRGFAVTVEADSALAQTGRKARAFPLTTSTNSSLAPGKAKLRSLPLATSLMSALEIVRGNIAKVLALPTVIAAQTVVAFGKTKRRTAALATEVESVLAVGRAKVKAIASASIVSSALAPAKRKARAVSLATVANAAQALGRTRTRLLPVVLQTTAAVSLGRTKARALAQAAQSNAVVAIGRLRTRLLPTAGSSSLSVAFGARKGRLLPFVTSIDLAQAIAQLGKQILILPTAVLTSAAQALGKLKRRDVAMVSGGSLSITPGRVKSRTLAQATTSSVALGYASAKRKALATVASATTAVAISASRSRVLATALELASSLGLLPSKSKELPISAETALVLVIAPHFPAAEGVYFVGTPEEIASGWEPYGHHVRHGGKVRARVTNIRGH